jgi:hypothetical protein
MGSEVMTIKLTVAQRTIELTIKREWEYYYRKAEQVINEKFLEFANRWNYTDEQDLLSKILIDFVVKWVENEERLAEYDDDLIPMMEELKALSETMEVGE